MVLPDRAFSPSERGLASDVPLTMIPTPLVPLPRVTLLCVRAGAVPLSILERVFPALQDLRTVPIVWRSPQDPARSAGTHVAML